MIMFLNIWFALWLKSFSLKLGGVVFKDHLHERRHLLDLNHIVVKHVVVLPSVAEINLQVVLKFLACEVKLFLDDFSGGFHSALLVDPVLRVLLNFIVIHIAASAVTTAILGQLPEVIFGGIGWFKAAIAVATAVDLDVHASSCRF